MNSLKHFYLRTPFTMVGINRQHRNNIVSVIIFDINLYLNYVKIKQENIKVSNINLVIMAAMDQ